MNLLVRPYRAADRAAVRAICADTGFMGGPIDRIFADREAFADFFTRYYTDFEPDCALVTEDADDGRVVGYMLGSVRYRLRAWLQAWLMVTQLVPRVGWRLLSGRYDRESRRFLLWVVFRSIRETPPAPRGCAHFHINLLPQYRNGVFSRRMIFAFIDLARARGARGVYGQIQTQDHRRVAFWQRYGFREFGRRRITKFERVHPDAVYVTTLYRIFERG